MSLSEPLLFQSYTAWSARNLASMESVLNYLQNSRFQFIFTTLLVHTTTLTISTKNILHHFSFFFTALFHPYLFIKSSLTIYTKTSFLYTSAIFHLAIFAYSPQFRLRQRTNEQGSLVRTNTVLSSLFFLKASTGIKGLTTTNSLSIKVSDWDACNQNGKLFNSSSPLPSIYSH